MDEPEQLPTPKSLGNALKNIEAGVKNDDVEFEQAKAEVMEIIDTGKGSLDQLMELCSQSQHPRAYEVLANMINTLVGANKTILEMKVLNAKSKYIDAKTFGTGPGANAKVIEGTVVGSTKDIQDMIKRGEAE